jgi:hypothetical protein
MQDMVLFGSKHNHGGAEGGPGAGHKVSSQNSLVFGHSTEKIGEREEPPTAAKCLLKLFHAAYSWKEYYEYDDFR